MEVQCGPSVKVVLRPHASLGPCSVQYCEVGDWEMMESGMAVAAADVQGTQMECDSVLALHLLDLSG